MNASDTQRKKLVEPRTLKGFRDVLPAEAIVKNQMLGTVIGVFESFGFVPIQTPHLEYTECLLGDASAEIQKQVYRFKDQGERDVALRFDLTVPFARFISQHMGQLGLPFKRWAVGEVFRGENPQAGRYREFTQCDFDIIGVDSVAADAEIVQVIHAAISKLGISRFQIRVNSRRLMNGVAERFGVAEKSASIIQELDKFDKIGRDAVANALRDEHGIPAATVDDILSLVALSAADMSAADTIAALRPRAEGNQVMQAALDELQQFFRLLAASGVREPHVRLDLSVARGFGYYTGIVYETNLLDRPRIGSVCSGGRYDNLTQTFIKDRCPGVGASIGLDRLMAALTDMGLLSTRATTAAVLVTQSALEVAELATRVASALRDGGVAVELYPEPHKMKRQVDYAKKRGHRFLVAFPANSSESDFVVEDMTTGNRITVAGIEAARKLIAGL